MMHVHSPEQVVSAEQTHLRDVFGKARLTEGVYRLSATYASLLNNRTFMCTIAR